MKHVSISQSEIHEIKHLHESILSKSSHGLFYSIGRILGEHMASEIQDWDRFFEEATMMLRERCVVEDMSVNAKTVTVEGSIEIEKSDHPTCDILRGAIVALYNSFYGKKVYCEETQCKSMGADKCVFEVREEVI